MSVNVEELTASVLVITALCTVVLGAIAGIWKGCEALYLALKPKVDARRKAYDLCLTTKALCDYFDLRVAAQADRKELAALRTRTCEGLVAGEQCLSPKQAIDLWKKLHRLERDLGAMA